jgi:quercetin dioxygenase-like cupin family protein
VKPIGHAVPEPVAFDVAGLVAYQKGSVVSRQVLKKETGTVTLFAFSEGEGLSEHTAPFDALVHVIDGDADVVIAGTTHRVRAGHAIVLPAGRPHSLSAPVPFKMVLTMIRAAT